MSVIEEGDWTETHQRSVPSSVVGSGARIRIGLARAIKGVQGLSGSLPNVKALSIAGQVAFLVPPPVTFALVYGVETLTLDQAFTEAERQASIICPLQQRNGSGISPYISPGIT